MSLCTISSRVSIQPVLLTNGTASKDAWRLAYSKTGAAINEDLAQICILATPAIALVGSIRARRLIQRPVPAAPFASPYRAGGAVQGARRSCMWMDCEEPQVRGRLGPVGLTETRFIVQ